MSTSPDFELGPKIVIRPDWTEQHEFIPFKEDPLLCGHEEEPLLCLWPRDSEYHYEPSEAE